MITLKKIFFSLLVAGFLAFSAWAYFNLKNSKRPGLEALSVMPDSCSIYLKTGNYFELHKKISSQSMITDKLRLFPEIHKLFATLSAFDSVLNSEALLMEVIEDNDVHFALYPRQQGWLIAFNLKEFGKHNLMVPSLEKALKAQNKTGDAYSFELNKEKLLFCLTNGIVLLSNAKTLIDLSIDKNDEKLCNNALFLKYKKALSDDKLMSIFVNHKIYARSKASSALNLAIMCNKGVSAGSIDLLPSELIMNGYLTSDTTELISTMYDQEKQPTDELIKALPVNTVFFYAYAFNSYSNLMSHPGLSAKENLNFWRAVNETGLYKVENDFNQNLTTFLVGFQTWEGHNYIACNLKDPVKAGEHLVLMSDSVLVEDSIRVYRIKNRSSTSGMKLFYPLINSATRYAFVYGQHVYFCENKTALTPLLQELKNNLLLPGNASFLSYKNEQIGETFNYLVYCSPCRFKKGLASFFNFSARNNTDPFENLKHFSYTLSNHSGDFAFRLHLMNEVKKDDEEPDVLWTLGLDTNSTMKAFPFVNHITGENELTVQDNRTVLYLINAKGTLLWKKRLGEPILSDILMVDAFKNNKYQLLFNTAGYLHLIDRNGKYVEGYPVKLPVEAVSSLNLFDYEKNKDYRITIPCKNKIVYNYSVSGIPLDGFLPVKTENEVALAIQYVKVGTSDYLVAVDRGGKIYVFSRKGIPRLDLINKTIENCATFYVDAGNSLNNTYLVYVDEKNGLINKISFADKKEIVKLNKEIENASIVFKPTDNRRSPDLLITRNNSILAFTTNGNLLFEKSTATNLSRSDLYTDESHSVLTSLIASEHKLVVSDLLSQRTALFNATALPLISNLFSDNKKYMVITNGRQLNCVPLN